MEEWIEGVGSWELIAKINLGVKGGESQLGGNIRGFSFFC